MNKRRTFLISILKNLSNTDWIMGLILLTLKAEVISSGEGWSVKYEEEKKISLFEGFELRYCEGEKNFYNV